MSDPGGVGGAPQAATRVVVMGLMGSGKTTLGKRLARRLGWPLRDSDEQLRVSTGLTAREIRAAHGTEALHVAEAHALLEALGQPGPAVICAAASTIEVSAARAALTEPGVVAIWLRGAPAVLARRFAGGSHRPVYGADPEVVARDQARIRDPLFAAVDPVRIRVDGRTPAAVLERALSRLRERGVPIP